MCEICEICEICQIRKFFQPCTYQNSTYHSTYHSSTSCHNHNIKLSLLDHIFLICFRSEICEICQILEIFQPCTYHNSTSCHTYRKAYNTYHMVRNTCLSCIPCNNPC